MTQSQEDALYDFLDNATDPFTLDQVVAFIRMASSQKSGRLSKEISSLISSRNIAFPMGTNRWISRRGCFETAPFVISPSRLELVNGILIPGHRCLPFASPHLLPQEYVFYWNGKPIPVTTTEGAPEDFYPYYTLFGEEYAPQYVARDNPDNESAFNQDPYDDPVEVSIHTLDMRNIYRESSFVPGDRFVVRTRDWMTGVFDLQRVAKDAWTEEELFAWLRSAEKGFTDSFQNLGPGSSTEEQIAFAYWYGGNRMRDIPAYALDEYLYEKTEHIESTAYGIESRFWYAGKEIPDRLSLEDPLSITDRTFIEDLLRNAGVPISEYVIQAYVRDALYRNDLDISHIVERILPMVVGADEQTWTSLFEYVNSALGAFQSTYSLFTDQAIGPIRQRVGELHTAVIELVARLRKGNIKLSCLPKHTFVVLSQIQSHTAILLEDLDMEETPPDTELEAMDNSLDSMIETYEDMKELIDDALHNFRRQGFSVVKSRKSPPAQAALWYTLQFSLGGTDIWRRILIPETVPLRELHRIIGILFDWKDDRADPPNYRFSPAYAFQDAKHSPFLDREQTLTELNSRGIMELRYEYNNKWLVKILVLSSQSPLADEASPVRCVAGAGAAPPEFIDGPLQLKRYLDSRGSSNKSAPDYDPGEFDLNACNRDLASRL